MLQLDFHKIPGAELPETSMRSNFVALHIKMIIEKHLEPRFKKLWNVEENGSEHRGEEVRGHSGLRIYTELKKFII